MKVTIESTSKIVQLVDATGAHVNARVWEGHTESGIPIHCMITRLGVANNKGYDHSQFERELDEQRAPSFEVAAFPLRFIL